MIRNVNLTGAFISSPIFITSYISLRCCRNPEQKDANIEEVQRTQGREERKRRRDAMAEKYNIVPKSAGHMQDPKRK